MSDQGAVTVPKGQTIAQVLRALRPFLPAGFQKSSERGSVGYCWGDRAHIEVFGVCAWNATTQEKEGCHATSIVITPGGLYRRSDRQRNGLRTTSHRPRKDGTFKLDSIGARLQYVLAQVAEMQKARDAEEKRRTEDRAAEKALQASLAAWGKANGINPAVFEGYGSNLIVAPKPKKGPENQDDPWPDDEKPPHGPMARVRNGPKCVKMDLEHLTPAQAKRVLMVLKGRKR